MGNPKKRILYTLGYGSLKLPKLVEFVEGRNLVVVDVRMSTRSKNPSFSKTSLQNHLGSKRYKHFPEFGNVNYRGGEIELKSPIDGLLKIRKILKTHSVILLCACWNHHTCHRTNVAQYISEADGYEIYHLSTKTVHNYNIPEQFALPFNWGDEGN